MGLVYPHDISRTGLPSMPPVALAVRAADRHELADRLTAWGAVKAAESLGGCFIRDQRALAQLHRDELHDVAAALVEFGDPVAAGELAELAEPRVGAGREDLPTYYQPKGA